MKHIYSKLPFTLLLLAISANATITLDFKLSGFGDENSASVNGLAWGIVIDTDGSATNGDFSGTFQSDLASALNGFALPGTTASSDGVQLFDEYYFASAQADTTNSGPPSMTDGYINRLVLNLDVGGSNITAGDDYGLIWFSVSSGSTITGSDFFGFQDVGVLPSDGSTIDSFPGVTAGQTLTAVPEPSTFALFFGLFAAILIVRSRRA